MSGNIKGRVKMRQVGGDDGYQWCVFVDGREKVNGCTRSEAAYYKERFERDLRSQYITKMPEPKPKP